MKLDELNWGSRPVGDSTGWSAVDLPGSWAIFKKLKEDSPVEFAKKGNYLIRRYLPGTITVLEEKRDVEPIMAQCILNEILKDNADQD